MIIIYYLTMQLLLQEGENKNMRNVKQIKLLKGVHLTGTERKHLRALINKEIFRPVKVNHVKHYNIKELQNNTYECIILSKEYNKFREQTITFRAK